MKIRVTLMTENDSYLDDSITKEEIERKAALGWKLLMEMLSNKGNKNDRAIVEACELISRD